MGEDGIKGLLWLFHDLNIPSYDLFANHKYSISFFTESGNDKYKDAINEVNNAYLERSMFYLEKITCNIPEDSIIYKDDDQIITDTFKEYDDMIANLEEKDDIEK